MINRPIWLRAAINNARVATASAGHSEDAEERASAITAGAQLAGFVVALLLLGYVAGVLHMWAAASDYTYANGYIGCEGNTLIVMNITFGSNPGAKKAFLTDESCR